MRTYPRNSPDAAARIVALMLLADGHVDLAELQVLQRLDAEEELGLLTGQLQRVLDEVWVDLLVGWGV